MDRRKSLKLIATVPLRRLLLLDAVKRMIKKQRSQKPERSSEFTLDRNPEEMKHEKAITGQRKFFTEHEMATITMLADIIIPKDEVSGSASDAKVPDFIEFIVKDMPQHQIPMRGGFAGWICNA